MLLARSKEHVAIKIVINKLLKQALLWQCLTSKLSQRMAIGKGALCGDMAKNESILPSWLKCLPMSSK